MLQIHLTIVIRQFIQEQPFVTKKKRMKIKPNIFDR